jgi:hypothetical protein
MPFQPQPQTVFISYAPEDDALRQELEKHLALLQRQGYITSWSSRLIGAGAEARAESDRKMEEAQAILLLLSADFLASDELYEVELTRALARRSEGVVVKGVLLRPIDWAHGKLAGLSVAPARDGKIVPVTSWPSHDEAFARVAEALRDDLRGRGFISRISVNPTVAHPR